MVLSFKNRVDTTTNGNWQECQDPSLQEGEEDAAAEEEAAPPADEEAPAAEETSDNED